MRHVIKRDQVQVEETRAAPAARPAKTAAPTAAADHVSRVDALRVRVRTLRVEGRVRAIEVTCACGEVSLVELDYAPSPAPATRAPAAAAPAAEPARALNEVKS